jgi:pyrroline-5-carboxylate reductase
MKICFIGFGNMAKAIAQGLQNSDQNYQISAASPSLPKGQTAEGITTDYDNLAVIDNADLIILAVKPIEAAKVLTQIKGELPKNCLLLSVAAGLSLSWLEKHCRKGQAIVRSMPNTPIAVGKGATPLIANQFVSAQQKRWAEHLFQCCGIIAWTTEENDMDPFTALSGSGPAYVFLFLESLISAAKKLGLSEEIAKTFALQTLAGALSLASTSELEISELRKKVTSPAGTTAAAIDILQQEGFEKLILKAMEAAFKRAKQLQAPTT